MRDRKIIVNQILLSILWYRGQIYPIPKYIKEEIEQRIYNFLWNSKKCDLPDKQLNSRGGLGILDRHTIKLYIKKNGLLVNPTNVLWKCLVLYWLKLILNSDQGLSLFRQKQIRKSTNRKNLQKQNNEDFFILLLYAWLHLTNNNFLAPCL